MTVAEAVRRFVHDGDYLAIGGFGADRIPTAVFHEILRQGSQNLGFAGHTATHDFQILCAGNLTGRGQTLAKVDVAYVVGLEARGLSPHARRVMESGEVECVEWTNYTLAVRFTRRRDGRAVPAGPHPARHRHASRHSPAKVDRVPVHRRERSSPCRPSTRTWPPSTSTRPTATATAASPARRSPTSTWPAPPSASSSPASG